MYIYIYIYMSPFSFERSYYVVLHYVSLCYVLAYYIISYYSISYYMAIILYHSLLYHVMISLVYYTLGEPALALDITYIPGRHNKIPAYKIFARVWVAQ